MRKVVALSLHPSATHPLDRYRLPMIELLAHYKKTLTLQNNLVTLSHGSYTNYTRPMLQP